MRPLWYEDAVIYAVDVETFQDSNGDGVGDFAGLTRRLPYIDALGVSCLWLLPFFPSGGRDNGYDITDYYDVDPRFGGLGDFVRFMQEATDRGIRVMIDLVVNHTSDQHPWFQAARRHHDSKHHDYYLWRDEEPKDPLEKVVFKGVEQSPWHYDDVAGQFYLHHFYAHEPDLNIANPEVQNEIFKIVDFWMQQGVAGFRIDAAPYIVRKAGGAPESSADGHVFLRRLRDVLAAGRAHSVLLAEADVRPNQYDEYFGGGDEVQMLFQFVLNNFLYLALADEEAGPLIRGLETLPQKPRAGQWVNWVRNFDELDLERLSRVERERVFRRFAPEDDMRVYGRGIRRLLAPMVGGDGALQRLTYALVFSFPGSPMLRQGEEIGMGDDLSQPERNAVRAPMQWSDHENGGFSSSPPGRLVRPVLEGGPFGYQEVNVAAQDVDPGSLLHFVRRLVAARKQGVPIGRGSWRLLDSAPLEVLAIRYDLGDDTVVTFSNLSPDAVTVPADECKDLRRTTELLTDRPYPVWTGDGTIEIEGYGYRWLRGRRG